MRLEPNVSNYAEEATDSERRPSSKLHRSADWLSNQATRFAPWFAALLLVEVFAFGVLKAYYRPLWLDEIMEVLIAKLPRMSDIVAICKTGADNQPLAYHWAMRQSIALFHNDALGTRVPSLVGFVVCCFCIYRLVSRHAGPVYGTLAMMFPLFTRAWYYATEGRPYGLMFGFAGVAALSWHSIAMNRRRAPALAGLALAILCSLNTHYYAVLLLCPLCLAEAYRTWLNRKLDLLVWVALVAPLSVLLVYLPIIRASRLASGIPYASFTRPSFWTFTEEFLQPAAVPLFCAGAVFLAYRCFVAQPQNRLTFEGSLRKLRRPEALLVLGFSCIPIFAVFLSKYGTHIFFTRYAIAGVLGFAMLFGFCTWIGMNGAAAPASILVLVMTALLAHNQKQDDLPFIKTTRALSPRGFVLGKLPQALQADNLPIVPVNLDDFMKLYYYGDSSLRARLFYLGDEVLADRYLGFTFNERMMIGSAPFFRTQVVSYEDFIGQHKSFYVFGTLEFWQWVVPKLLTDQVQLRLIQGGPLDKGGDYFDTCFKADVTATAAVPQ